MSERVTITDGSLITALDRWLTEVLKGGREDNGLYITISHSIANWENYLVMRGRIAAYEDVQAKMKELAKERGDALEEQVIFSRDGLMN